MSDTETNPTHFDITTTYETELRPLVQALLERCQALHAPCVVQVITKSTPEVMDVQTSQAGLADLHDMDTRLHHLAVFGASATNDYDGLLAAVAYNKLSRAESVETLAP